MIADLRTGVTALLIALCAAPPAHAACDRAQFPVAVDIGHTPQAPGATSARGIPELAFNIALGRDAAAALRQAGFPAYQVMVQGLGKEQLSRRVAAAHALAPALLISIHHDSVQERYLEDWRFAGQPRKFSDRFSGFSIFVSEANRYHAESLEFAKALGRSLTSAGLAFSTHHGEMIPGENRRMLDPDLGVFAFRQLKVLKDAPAPALLLEAGVIVNRAEELALASPQRRDTVAASITEAVTAMCERQSGKLVLR